MIIIGIDPGLSGACAVLDHNGMRAVFDLPTVDLPGKGSVRRRVHGPGLAAALRQHWPAGESAVAFIEELSAGGKRARPGEQMSSSAQTIGSQYRTRGTIECTLEMLRLEVIPVHARSWKSFFGLIGEEDATKRKAAGLDMARRLYPGRPELKRAMDHNRGEALLIAHWGMRKHGHGAAQAQRVLETPL